MRADTASVGACFWSNLEAIAFNRHRQTTLIGRRVKIIAFHELFFLRLYRQACQEEEHDHDKVTALENVQQLLYVLQARPSFWQVIRQQPSLYNVNQEVVEETDLQLFAQFLLRLYCLSDQVQEAAVFDKFSVGTHHFFGEALIDLIPQVQIVVAWLLVLGWIHLGDVWILQ